ncbi:jerky protein homolog-like [Ochlerotatus camptorhynchus]|uniref:jerky protein homolog-like n=1 Tax=Ochlerotatus camptorhynchus TaxID=644619 RepID=UPI0031DFFC49
MVRHYVKKRLPAAYTKETLLEAVQAVRSKRFTLYSAAKYYKIPKTTLCNRVHGKRGVKSSTGGRPTALPLEVEARLATNIKTMEKWGFGLSKPEIVSAIEQHVKKTGLKTPFKDSVPGDDFFVNFKRRNQLSQKKPQAVEVARKQCVDPFAIADYFELLKEVTQHLPPDRIYNMDETSFCLDPSRVLVVGEKGKAAHRVTAGPGRENYSVLMGANAAGDKLPPLIIFKAKNVWDSWLADKKIEYPGMSYAATPNGWMDTETFTNYFRSTFLKSIPKTRPVVLIYDGHSSHTSLELVEQALQENVVILKLPPHTSHLLQPMDLSVFKPLKQKYDDAIVKWQRKNYGIKLNKSTFAGIISDVWTQCNQEIIKHGFRKAGIYPFCADVIPQDKYDPWALKRFQLSRLSNAAVPSAEESWDLFEAGPSNLDYQAPKESVMSDQKNAPFDENSFELILLEHVKQNRSTQNVKKRKVCPGAEVITSEEAIQRMRNSVKQEKIRPLPKVLDTGQHDIVDNTKPTRAKKPKKATPKLIKRKLDNLPHPSDEETKPTKPKKKRLI